MCRKNIEAYTMASIKGIKNSNSSGNTKYLVGQQVKSRPATVKEVKAGKHPGYHTVDINGVEYVRADPDKKESNNVNS
jgi:hypothetical protein